MQTVSGIDVAGFDRLVTLIKAHWGINLDERKLQLVAARLRKTLARHGCSSIDAYCDTVLERDPSALGELVDRISTNHTFFYRESAHFELLERELPQLLAAAYLRKRARDLRTWCAACSTGEEPYTLAALIQRAVKQTGKPWQASVLATDISEAALTKAREGVYPTEDVANLPPELRAGFERGDAPGTLRVTRQLRAEVTFRRFNLMRQQFPFRQKFDVIFCRNVMIYFDRPTRHRLIAHLRDWLVPGGLLCIGHSESVPRGMPGLEPIQAAAYRRIS